MAFSLSQTTGSITHSRWVNVPNPQSVEAMTRSRSPTAATASRSAALPPQYPYDPLLDHYWISRAIYGSIVLASCNHLIH